MSQLENETLLFLITTQMRNKGLCVLYSAGLWPVMRRFVGNELWWYLRTQTLTTAKLEWKPREWSKVYMNLRSAIGRDGVVDFSGDILRSRRLSHLDTMEVAFEIGYDLPEMEPQCESDESESDSNERTPREVMLGWVCEAGSVPVLSFLEQRGWKIKPEHMRAYIIRVAQSGMTDMLSLLLERESLLPVNMELLLSEAAIAGHTETVQFLLAHTRSAGALMVGGELLVDCVRLGHEGVVRLLLEDERVWCNMLRAVEMAVERGRMAILDLLLNRTASQTEELVENAIVRAARKNNLDLVRRLACRSVKVNRNKAFYCACSRGHLDMAQLLFRLGGVDVAYGKCRALQVAVRKGQIDVVSWLLSFERVDPLAGKKCALYQSMRSSGWKMRELMLHDRRIWQYDLDLKDLEANQVWRIPNEARTRLSTCARMNTRSPEAVLREIEQPCDLYTSLLQFLIIKGPTDDEIVEWFKLRDDDENVRLAIKGAVVQRQRVEGTVECHAFRAVLLVALGSTAEMALVGLEGETLQKAKTLVYALPSLSYSVHKRTRACCSDESEQ